MKANLHKLLAIFLIFLCWAPQIQYLFPIPDKEMASKFNSIAHEYSEGRDWILENSLEKNKDFSTPQIYKKMWYGWAFYSFAIFLGLTSGLLSYFKWLKWKIFTILSSALYLVSWYTTGSTSSFSLIKSFELKYNVAKSFGTYGTFLYKDVFLPVAFTFIIIYIVRSFKRPDLV
jgi:hypothetical protein